MFNWMSDNALISGFGKMPIKFAKYFMLEQRHRSNHASGWKHADYGVIFKKYVELTRPKIESRDPIFFTGTRACSRVSGNE